MTRFAVIAALVCTSCGGLEVLDFGMCGNGVLEPNSLEDCDTNAVEGTCGPPGSAGACRFICENDDDCPGGRQCGKDGICRQPARQFERAAGSPYPSIGRRFRTADLDADGNLDVIGTNQRGGVLLFGRGDVTFDGRTSLFTGPPTAPLVSGHLSSNETQDIVAPVGRGLQITRVDRERRLSPVAHSLRLDALTAGQETIVLPLRIGGLFDAIVVVVQTPANGAVIAVRQPPGTVAIEDTTIAELNLANLVGRPVTGDIDATTGDGTHELAFTLNTSTEIRIFGLDCRAQPCRWIERVTVPTPQGRTVTDGVALADADGDGDADLFFGVEGELFLARSNGDGTFAPATMDERATSVCAQCAGWPLAIADIDGDQRADFVTAGGVVTTSSASARVRHRPARSGVPEWSLAAIADFDGDGGSDVVVGALGEAGVELVVGSEQLFFNTFFLETTRAVFGVSAGDFDGDGIADLAIVEGSSDSAVSVSYGQNREPLAAPLEMARFDRVTGAEPALAVGLGRDMIDFRSDLLVSIESDGDPPTNDFAVLIGTEARRMVAPALLGEEPGDENRAHAVSVGTFDATSDRDDVLAISQSMVWLFGTDDDGAIDRDQLADGLSAIDGRRDVITRAAQLDGDAFDEIVVLSGAFPLGGAGGVTPSMYIVDPDGTDSIEVREVTLPDGMTAPSGVSIADLDGSGNPSVVVAFAGDDTGLAIYRTNGGARIEDAPTIVRPGDGRSVVHATIANIDDDSNVEILMLTEDEVLPVELDDGVWALGDALELGERAASNVAGIGAADIDEDGVTDIAIADDAGFYVFRALEKIGRVTQ